ncbi:MAG: tRNA (N(6)-L-threonylcarbamoyladenosine(37)-C(2))-methylthiotransferase [archaeon]
MTNVCVLGFGCVANQDNIFIMKGLLTEAGYDLVDSPEKAEVVVIGTCTVKLTTENKMRSLIVSVKDKKLVITGCMPQAQKKLCEDIAPDASLVNTCHIKNIVEVVENLLQNKKSLKLGFEKEVKLGLPKIIKDKNIATVQIAEGCRGKCTFCIVKLAKGEIVSYPQEKIVQEISSLVDKGYTKILLTAQDTAAYGLDLDKKSQLPSLINEICKIDKKFILRVGMMNPMHVVDITEELIESFKDEKIFKFLHVPIQSGSDKVLRDMARPVTVEQFKTIVKLFRNNFPGMSIATDVIVGYPTETEDDFKQTVALVKELKFEVFNISKFTPRPGTKASELKPLNTKISKKRSAELDKLFKSYSPVLGSKISTN